MIKSGLGRATKQFFLTTTLHGFKYLYSGSKIDRVCWLTWCVASACCAGTLCAVLWARFLQVPALLTVRSTLSTPQTLPAIAVCLPAAAAAYLLVGNLSKNNAEERHMLLTFTHVLQGKDTSRENLEQLDRLLVEHNVTLLDALHNNMPPCKEFAKKCRWRNTIMNCSRLFHRRVTQFGMCCVMKPHVLKPPKELSVFDQSNQLTLVLKCSKKSLFLGCQFFTKYEGEETVNPVTLVPGSEYLAQLTFTSIQDSDTEKLVTGACVSSELYSKTMCMDTCMERLCGCSNPLQNFVEDNGNMPPPCSLTQVSCLFKIDNSSCNCLPSCKTISTDLWLENSIMKSVEYTLDPMYADVDVSSSTVLHLRVFVGGSRIFMRQPTETWFTLLCQLAYFIIFSPTLILLTQASLGGVFSMFLGVGLFSALEFLFFLLVRIPAAMKTYPEVDVSITHVQSHH